MQLHNTEKGALSNRNDWEKKRATNWLKLRSQLYRCITFSTDKHFFVLIPLPKAIWINPTHMPLNSWWHAFNILSRWTSRSMIVFSAQFIKNPNLWKERQTANIFGLVFYVQHPSIITFVKWNKKTAEWVLLFEPPKISVKNEFQWTVRIIDGV